MGANRTRIDRAHQAWHRGQRGVPKHNYRKLRIRQLPRTGTGRGRWGENGRYHHLKHHDAKHRERAHFHPPSQPQQGAGLKKS